MHLLVVLRLLVERSDTRVELRTLNEENPGSNPVVLNLGQVFFTLD